MVERTARADVVVGVDGSEASVAAVRYGAGEARRTGGVLRVVHVLPDYAASPYPLPMEEVAEAGRTVLRTTLERVGPVASEVPVRTALRRGSRSASLVADARAAHVLVVGADRRAALARLLTGNTSTRVAATSVAPVVSVPETWTPAAHGVVLAAVKRADRATDVLAEAFEVAAERGSRLVVLHAWRIPSEYDDVVGSRAAVEEWDARARAELTAVLADWRTTYPDVDVELRIVHDQPAHALVAASAEVDELVLVRRAHGVPAAAHLGSTARTVLREAACPVRVVAPGHAVAVPGLLLEDAGSARK
jgi:nucleotide-binding universal stress UspA family protein